MTFNEDESSNSIGRYFPISISVRSAALQGRLSGEDDLSRSLREVCSTQIIFLILSNVRMSIERKQSTSHISHRLLFTRKNVFESLINIIKILS